MVTKNHLNISLENNILQCQGDWTLKSVVAVRRELSQISTKPGQILIIDGQSITNMDTVGSWLLQLLQERLTKQGCTYELRGFSSEHLELLEQVVAYKGDIEQREVPKKLHNWLYRLGYVTTQKIFNAIDLL